MAQQSATNTETLKIIRGFGKDGCKEGQNSEGQRCPQTEALRALSPVARPESPRPDPVEVLTEGGTATRNILDTFQVPT